MSIDLEFPEQGRGEARSLVALERTSDRAMLLLADPVTDKALAVRRATADQAAEVARLLHDFHAEFSEPTPEIAVLKDRRYELLADGEITVLLGGERPDGLAVLRFRQSLMTDSLDAYLEELYVTPERRGRGLGRALLEAAIELARDAGADHIDLGTNETDTAARALYESCGFSNRENHPVGPTMLYYERDL